MAIETSSTSINVAIVTVSAIAQGLWRGAIYGAEIEAAAIATFSIGSGFFATVVADMRALLLILFAFSAVAAEDAWMKVQALKSGTELKIYQRGKSQPLMANFDEATEDKLLVATKNEQRAIAKEDIDRIDSRSPRTGSRVTRETRTKTTDPVSQQPLAGVPSAANVPTQSQSSSVSFGSGKADFETVYRRLPPAK